MEFKTDFNLFKEYFITGADFSEDQTHRYSLWRIWDASLPQVAFIGLNPSKAGDVKNDNTITKVMKIAKHNGFGGLYMLNLFSYISTNPKALQWIGLENAVGERNNDAICHNIKHCEQVVAAWGNFKEPYIKINGQSRADEVLEMLTFIHGSVMCLHKNQNGSPKHPLYCKDDSKLILYR